MTKYIKRLAAVFLALVLYAAMAAGGYFSARIALAEIVTGGTKMDSSNVMDDLEGSTIDGVPFDIANYAFDENKQTQVILFAEYCYSYYSNRQSNYGLYVYVWNPQGLSYNFRSVRNSITLSSEGESYEKYSLYYLDQSEGEGRDGLFIKFRVAFSEEEERELLESLTKESRIYRVGELELVQEGAQNASAYAVGKEYRFSGFAAGYGSDPNAQSTLTCTEIPVKTLSLEVHSTFYRPEGTNGKNEYTQDSLHSVYFAVPKEVIEEYGSMSAVHAVWLDAVLAPALVTGNGSAYEAISAYLGQDIGENAAGLGYAYVGNAEYVVTGTAGTEMLWGWTGSYGYNLPSAWMGLGGSGSSNEIGRTVSPLYLLFSSGSGQNSADSYVVSSEQIREKLAECTQKYGGELVNEKYSRVLFDEVAEEFTDINISVGYEYDLRSEVLGDSWWEKLLGVTHDQSDRFDGIPAICAVSDGDFVYTGGEIDAAATCKNLYIAEQDLADFREFYEENKDDSVVYLFRYQVSDYIASEATLFRPDSLIKGVWNKQDDTNAYFFQETLNLDFDVIDVTFTSDGTDTVMPAVSSPIDVIPDATPPVNTTEDGGVPWWAYVILVVGELIVLLVLRLVLCKLCGLPNWLMILLVAAVVVLDIFFLEVLSAWLAALLEPYLGWLPFS